MAVKTKIVRVAVPLTGERFCAHFGRCDGLFLAECEMASRSMTAPRRIVRKQAGCEHMPQWLRELAVELVLAGGIGGGARQRLQELGIAVVAGLHGEDPVKVVEQYLAQPDAARVNPCADEFHHEHQHCRH